MRPVRFVRGPKISHSLQPPKLRQSGAPISRNFFTSTWSTTAQRPARLPISPSFAPLPTKWQPSILRHLRLLRFNSFRATPPKPNPTPHLGSPEPAPSLSARLKKLSREYGWSALGVYLLLSALDFPFCFLAVRMLGTERIGRWEHVVIENFWKVVQIPFPNLRKQRQAEEAVQTTEPDGSDVATAREGALGWAGEVDAADERNKAADASLWTQLVLAYAIHKSFIFVRVPLTAAVTPKVVKKLRSWGWDIGRRPEFTKRKPKTK